MDFDRASGPVPSGWTQGELDDWLVYHPEGDRVPLQGWKIHVSASLDDAEDILAITWDYCVERRVAFKFIRSLQLLFLRNGKYAPRSASGKFITIYPRDDADLETICTELGARLEGKSGPYILSDLRWGAGPLYVRYGGFAERYCIGPAGNRVLALEDGDGRLIPDRRGPTFQVPAWVQLPACLQPHLTARNAVTVQDLPYRIERALHFSNGGGLYLGTELATGEQVVIKEARPHAGLAFDRADAVTRQERERRVLELLAGLEQVPAIRGQFALGDHQFLALDFIESDSLRSVIVGHYPFTDVSVDAETAQAFTDWALGMYERVEAAVQAVHDRGVVIGDLHPSNILVRPDGGAVLVDFEVAAEVAEGRRPTLGDPAFSAPPDRTGVDIDRYALACLRLYMFMPLTRLLILGRDKAAGLADDIEAIFPVPRSFLDDAVRTIIGPGSSRSTTARPVLAAGSERWGDLRESMTAAIVASATPQRNDRLYPGDIDQFATPCGGLNFANGAAGVLYALAAAGSPRLPDHEEWLVRRALHPEPGTPIGFYDGLHGVAHVLHRLGHRREAREVLGICIDELEGRSDRLGLDLVDGLSGIALNLAWFADATDDPSLLDSAVRLAVTIGDRLGSLDSVADTSGGDHPYAGLTRGSSGPALLFLRLYERTSDPALLDAAALALRQDLRRCTSYDYGALEVNEGWRTMPYLADGSVGIGFVLDAYLAHREDEQFATASSQISRTANSHFFIEPGLFYGRAGMILYLAARARRFPAEREQLTAAVAAQIPRLSWHALTYEGHLAFPGAQLLRLSMDLATGGAGILLALAAAAHETSPTLPFLDRPVAGADRQQAIGNLQRKGGE